MLVYYSKHIIRPKIHWSQPSDILGSFLPFECQVPLIHDWKPVRSESELVLLGTASGESCNVALLQSLGIVQLFATPGTLAHQGPLSMGFPRKDYWRGLHFLLQRFLLTQGVNPHFLHWQVDFLPLTELLNNSMENLRNVQNTC